MINKVAHYDGFQSYGQKHYASLKPGKEALTY